MAVNREPHGRRIGLRPLDPMASVGGNFDPVAGPQIEANVAGFEAQPRGARQQHDEFVVGLVVPEAWRACLAGRDDALDAQIRAIDQALDLLLGLA